MRNDDQLIALCQNVVKLRVTHNLTQEDMAKIMNIDTQQLQRMEANDIPDELDVGVLFRLEEHFHIAVRDLFYP